MKKDISNRLGLFLEHKREDAQLIGGFKTNREHVENFKSKRSSSLKTKNTISKTSMDSLICPQCGNDLILRTTKREKKLEVNFMAVRAILCVNT